MGFSSVNGSTVNVRLRPRNMRAQHIESRVVGFRRLQFPNVLHEPFGRGGRWRRLQDGHESEEREAVHGWRIYPAYQAEAFRPTRNRRNAPA